MKVEELITDAQIELSFGYANFGPDMTKRQVVNLEMLKFACRYGTGHTAKCICIELGLIDSKCKLTALGSQYVYELFKNKI